jgi:hypothetical protein
LDAAATTCIARASIQPGIKSRKKSPENPGLFVWGGVYRNTNLTD